MSNGNGPETTNSIISELSRQAVQVGNTAFGLPRRIEETIEKLEQGDLRLRVRSVETDRLLRRLGNMQMGTNYAVLVGAFILSATILLVNGHGWLALLVALLAASLTIGLIRLVRRIDKLDRMF
jgi:hypothetical protein